jgi:hypothetical protein
MPRSKDKKIEANPTWTLLQKAAEIKGCSVEAIVTLVTGSVCRKVYPGRINPKVRAYARGIVREKHAPSIPIETKLVFRRARRGHRFVVRVPVRST